MSKKVDAAWVKARSDWVAALGKQTTQTQKKEIESLRETKLFNEVEIIYKVFGWRSPISEQIWISANAAGVVPMGLNHAADYLLRVILGIPTHLPSDCESLHPTTTFMLGELLEVGIKNGHVKSGGKDRKQSCRVAVRETMKKLNIDKRDQDEKIDKI
jgi:hypothetical protein